MEGEHVRREVWEGKIPVCFNVAEEDLGLSLNSGERATTEPCYMLPSRVSYFPLVYDKLEKLYGRAVHQAPEDEIWLSAEAQPLKWQYPVGVLYDLFGHGTSLPWNVTVHFKEFPEEEIMHCPKEALEFHFRSRIKEADALKHRSEVTQTLAPAEFKSLWDGFKQGNFAEFWRVNQKFMLNIKSLKEPFKSIPFSIYQNGTPVFQRLLSPVKDGKDTTLEDVMKLYSSVRPMPDDHIVLIHGIEVSTDAQLQWLSENFVYPDNFLHICIVPRIS